MCSTQMESGGMVTAVRTCVRQYERPSVETKNFDSKNRSHLHSVPGTLISTLHVLTYLFLTISLSGRYCTYTHFTDEETKVQGD